MHKIKCSFSVFHCVNMEAFLFFFFFLKSRWRQSQETPSKAAQLTLQHCVPSRNTPTWTPQWFWPFARPLLPLWWGRKLQRFTWICTSMMWSFSVLQQGDQLFPFSWLNSSHSPHDTRLWVSFQQPTAGTCCRNAPSKQNTLLSCRQVKRPFSRWLHLRADGGFRLRIKRRILWGADLNQGWGQHSAPCKDKIQKLKAATGGKEGEKKQGKKKREKKKVISLTSDLKAAGTAVRYFSHSR